MGTVSLRKANCTDASRAAIDDVPLHRLGATEWASNTSVLQRRAIVPGGAPSELLDVCDVIDPSHPVRIQRFQFSNSALTGRHYDSPELNGGAEGHTMNVCLVTLITTLAKRRNVVIGQNRTSRSASVRRTSAALWTHRTEGRECRVTHRRNDHSRRRVC
jgi:hypothetical protein